MNAEVEEEYAGSTHKLPQRERWSGIIAFQVVVLLVATAWTLRAMGRNWWCACSTPHFFVTGIWSKHNSQHLLDPYTFSHVQHGFLLYGLLALVAPRMSRSARFLIALVLECGWEVLENTPWVIGRYRESTVSLEYFGDSVVNSAADVLACAAGFGLAAILPVSASVLAVVAIEAVMLLLIRDSLLLNVLMIVYPAEAVKQWQLGLPPSSS